MRAYVEDLPTAADQESGLHVVIGRWHYHHRNRRTYVRLCGTIRLVAGARGGREAHRAPASRQRVWVPVIQRLPGRQLHGGVWSSREPRYARPGCTTPGWLLESPLAGAVGWAVGAEESNVGTTATGSDDDQSMLLLSCTDGANA